MFIIYVMKKIILLILLIVSFSCSKDDNESSSGETFLKKFNNVGFVELDNNYPAYFYFYDSNVFIKNPVYEEELGGYLCQEITEGTSETILGDAVVKIITNNSTTLKLESSILGITASSEFIVNSSGETLTVTDDLFGEKETYTFSKTDISYSQICN